MRKLWAAMNFVGRLLGPALIVLAAGLFLFPPMPFFDVWPAAALAGAVISSVAWLLARAPEQRARRATLGILALAAFAVCGWQYWDAPRGFRTETVRFDNRGARLAGTLYLPDRVGKAPGIVFVQGSGPTTRASYGEFGRYFARRGYAVLVYDKRGVGESTGHYEHVRSICPDNIELLASDASAGLLLLTRRREVRADRVGFVGASQAGWIIPRAAVLNGKATFMLMLSGPTISTHGFWRYERMRVGPAMKQDWLSMLKAGMKASGRGDAPAGLTPDQAYTLAQGKPQTFDCPDYDPKAELRKLNIPGLWLVGADEWIVPAGQMARDVQALRTEGKPYEYRSISGAGHALLLGPRRPVVHAVDGWLARVTRE